MFDTGHLHPMVVHFPVALIIVGFLADVVYLFFKKEKCLSKTGFYLMILGTVAACAAFATGHLFTSEPTEGDMVNIFTRHETGALITILIMLTGSVVRLYLVINKKEESTLKWLVFLLYFFGTAAVSYTGLMGGTMVFNYMMGLF
jgi:uncharacterized membrane protein